MQDRDDLERLLNSKLGTLDDLQKEPMPAKAVKRTISLLPSQGDVVKLRGLDFSVRFVNKSTGVLHLSLTRVAEQRNEAVESIREACPADRHDYYTAFLSYLYCPYCGERLHS